VPIYRLILPGEYRGLPGRVDTGATLPTCSRENPNGCDPQVFSTVQEASAYAQSRGEVPRLVSSVEETWAIVDRENAARRALTTNTGPSQTPLPNPTGGGTVYRFILQTSPGRVDTGANYPACSRSNPSGCAPMGFASVEAAATYAYEHGEIPVLVSNVEEAWTVVAGGPVNPSNIIAKPEGMFAGMSPLTIAGLALSILWFFGKKRT
jgi:hypothetical protein